MLTITTAGGRVATLSIVFCALTFGAQVLRADVVLLEDFDGVVSFATTSTRITGGCGPSACGVDIAAPTGFRWDGSTGVPGVGGTMVGDGNNIAQPGGVFIADTIGTQDTVTATDFAFFFRSGYDSSPVPCDDPLNEIIGCSMTADGSIQDIGSVFWLDETGHILVTDTIELRSSAVPEPAAFLLLSPVVAALIVRKRKRTVAAN